MCMVVGVNDVIIHSNFGVNIFRGFWSTRGRNFRFPIDLLVIVTTVLTLPRSLWYYKRRLKLVNSTLRYLHAVHDQFVDEIASVQLCNCPIIKLNICCDYVSLVAQCTYLILVHYHDSSTDLRLWTKRINATNNILHNCAVLHCDSKNVHPFGFQNN